MTNRGRIRRLAVMAIAGGAAALSLVATATPAQATVTPFALRIAAVHSGLSLAASSPFLGAAVVQQTVSSLTICMLLVLTKLKRRFNLATGLYMDVSGSSRSSGGLVITFPLTGGSNQMFKQSAA